MAWVFDVLGDWMDGFMELLEDFFDWLDNLTSKVLTDRLSTVVPHWAFVIFLVSFPYIPIIQMVWLMCNVFTLFLASPFVAFVLTFYFIGYIHLLSAVVFFVLTAILLVLSVSIFVTLNLYNKTLEKNSPGLRTEFACNPFEDGLDGAFYFWIVSIVSHCLVLGCLLFAHPPLFGLPSHADMAQAKAEKVERAAELIARDVLTQIEEAEKVDRAE